MSEIFFTSDTHFCHNQQFLYEPRGFSSVEEMNESIIERWNSIVSNEDIVYHLGDTILNNDEEGIKCFNRLKGHIIILRGNHDTINRMNKMIESCHNLDSNSFEWATVLKLGKRSFYLSHYPTMTSNIDDEKKPWNKVHNLCGHSHTNDKWLHWNTGSYHVELDAHNCYPVSIDTIINEIREKYLT